MTKFPYWLTLFASHNFLLGLPQMPNREPVVVRESELGHAVYALCHFATDVKVGSITGTVVENPDYGSDYCMEFGEGRSLEAAPPFRFLNHSCDPNCELIFWEGETPSDIELCLHSIKPIMAGDELTIDYGWSVDVAIPCWCRSEKCRGWIVAETQLPFMPA